MEIFTHNNTKFKYDRDNFTQVATALQRHNPLLYGSVDAMIEKILMSTVTHVQKTNERKFGALGFEIFLVGPQLSTDDGCYYVAHATISPFMLDFAVDNATKSSYTPPINTGEVAMKLEEKIVKAAEDLVEMYVDMINGEVFNTPHDWTADEVASLNNMRRDLRETKQFLKDFANGGINYDRVVMGKIVEHLLEWEA
jgi:hypothetical protein